MIITPNQQPERPPRRNAFPLLCGAGPLVVACLLYTSAWGASTVYVAQSGNDQNNGAAPATAVKSVARGLALAAAGTEVKIAAGLYDEQLPPIPQGVTLSGGWDPSFTDTKRTLLTSESLRTLKPGNARCGLTEGAGLTCLTNSNGDRVVTLRSPGGQAAAATGRAGAGPQGQERRIQQLRRRRRWRRRRAARLRIDRGR